MRKIILLPFALLTIAGCSSNPFSGDSQISKTMIGTGAGAALGAGAGYALGSATNTDPKLSTLIGAGVGAALGAAVGSTIDKQEAELRQNLEGSGVSVTRSGNTVIMALEKPITFTSGKAKLTPETAKTLNSVAQVMQRYPKTKLTVTSLAAPSEPKSLAAQRSQAVASYLSQKGVAPSRLETNAQQATFAELGDKVELDLSPTA